jgi:predicted ferric reductase
MIAYTGVTLLIAADIIVWWQTPSSPSHMSARLAALIGYTSLFLAIVSSEYTTQVRRLLGMPFLRVHHFLAIVGLLLIVAHPSIMALEGQGVSLFIPLLDTLMSAIRNGGRIALYFFLLGALVAWQRRRLRFWRSVHYLNYAALFMACAHGLMLGSDLRGTVLTVLWPAMAAAAAAIFVHKRLRGS